MPDRKWTPPKPKLAPKQAAINPRDRFRTHKAISPSHAAAKTVRDFARLCRHMTPLQSAVAYALIVTDLLPKAFDWTGSPQGADYWAGVLDNLTELIRAPEKLTPPSKTFVPNIAITQKP